MDLFFVGLKEAESDRLASQRLAVHYGQRVIDQAMMIAVSPGHAQTTGQHSHQGLMGKPDAGFNPLTPAAKAMSAAANGL